MWKEERDEILPYRHYHTVIVGNAIVIDTIQDTDTTQNTSEHTERAGQEAYVAYIK